MTENDNDDVAAFFRANGARLLQTALLMTGNHHDAHDLLQDTMERTMRAWSDSLTNPGRSSRGSHSRLPNPDTADTRASAPSAHHP